jgi:uncharacterized protein
MDYRTYARGTEKISALGMGGEHWVGMPDGDVADIIHAAMGAGVNILDLFMPQPDVRSAIGRALKGRRSRMYIQGHLGATFQNGQYEKTRNIAQSKTAFDDLLARLDTDYIDFGMIHFVDTEAELADVFASGTMEMARTLKKSGVINRLGFSSHNPVIASKLVATGEFDLMMFSINAAWDMDSTHYEDLDAVIEFKAFTEGNVSVSGARAALYAQCANAGVGITVMKALGAGRLLHDATSPFGKAMTVGQCLRYALERPGVVSNLIGYRSVDEVNQAVQAQTESAEKSDYSALITSGRFTANGLCMYCNHCLPCPSMIDIAAVNKYLDLVPAGAPVPATVAAHYRALEHTADECVICGSCQEKCPFGVPVMRKMAEAAVLFGSR